MLSDTHTQRVLDLVKAAGTAVVRVNQAVSKIPRKRHFKTGRYFGRCFSKYLEQNPASMRVAG